MTAKAKVTQLEDGWRIELGDVESGVVETHGAAVIVRLDPGTDDTSKPLDVTLAQ